jgi:nitrogen fixation/metabolism regulation signal transduction histidine kinase
MSDQDRTQDSIEHILKCNESFFKTFLEALPYLGLILDDKRGILYSNQKLFSLFSLEETDVITGKRTGELFGCVNALNSTDECGCTPACQYCGIYRTVVESLKCGCRSENNTPFLTYRNGRYIALDLKVVATPFTYQDHQCVIVTFEDLSGENRRRMLERIFFHDITNSVGPVIVLSELFENDLQSVTKENVALLSQASKKIYDEIQSQKILLSAETNELAVVKVTINAADLINESVKQMLFIAKIQKKNIIVAKEEPVQCTTDVVLLQRVLLNLLKNAIEAIQPGETITCDYFNDTDFVTISINNPGVIPDDIKYHIFQRSFSTKGIGRGVGTYSVKLLVEQYLGGLTFFSSEPENGTTFYVRIPR